LDRYQRELGYESIRRVAVPVVEPAERLHGPDVIVDMDYNEPQALREASRCLDCGVTPVFDGTRCVLCGGCVDVCPTQCLKLVALDDIEPSPELEKALAGALGACEKTGTGTVPLSECARETPSGTEPVPVFSRGENSAILKDEDRCIRCALCAMRCPTDAITMERVTVETNWSTA
jgi:ferredoxin